MSTSAMATVYDKSQLLNISLTLQKRIRILGGVQSIYSYLSVLVVLNGRGAFVFRAGCRVDDKELDTISKIYKLTGSGKQIEMNLNKNKNKEQNQDIEQIDTKESNTKSYSNSIEQDQYQNIEFCSCTNPLFSENGDLFPTAPWHASIKNVRCLTDSKGNLKFES
ncbi:MAG: hypothetical protein EZS28_032578 [Streblomastix strix]|uniref:Uncharacterized protein n=1 Tax=Streblomastix strix TaxID=222440 RepID=A0A5J4UMJ4_9EUKA|nr:MAG: hypothetical protein EZS28_032578 [Streblomastix strix]